MQNEGRRRGEDRATGALEDRIIACLYKRVLRGGRPRPHGRSRERDYECGQRPVDTNVSNTPNGKRDRESDPDDDPSAAKATDAAKAMNKDVEKTR